MTRLRGVGVARRAARVSALSLVIALIVAACGSGLGRTPDNTSVASPGTPEPGALRVVTTTTVLADLVRQVGGTAVDVQSLVPKGGEVHTFDPTPADVQRVTQAKLVVANGLGLDDWLAALVTDAGSSAPIVRLGEGLPDVTYVAGSGAGKPPNPHLWLNVAYAIGYVTRIEAALAAADPGKAGAFKASADAYRARLAVLDTEIRARLATLPAADRVVVSFHDAFPYFAAAYGLTIVGSIVAAPGQDPSAGEIANLVGQIRSSGAKAIFAEVQFSPKLAEAIAGETGATVVANLYTDTVGDPPADTYVGMMRLTVDRVVGALTKP